MALTVLDRSEVIAALADDILHNYGKGRVIIAVDGLDGVGRSEFADALAARLGIGHRAVFRASMDDFQNSRATREAKGIDSAEGSYRNTFDYVTFKRMLVEPFRSPGSIGSFVLQAFDEERDIPFEPKWTSGPADAMLIVDGIYLNRPELKGIWNFSIWVEGEQAADGPDAEVEQLYIDESSPRTTATAIIDNTDVDHPRRRFADSC
jgi:uridine kinase